MDASRAIEAPVGWQDAALAELRRSRRYLLALTKGLSEEELEWFPRRSDWSCAKWHAGNVALHERQRLAQLVGGLRTDHPRRDLPFARHAMHDRKAEFPAWASVIESLASARRLSEALLENVEGDAAAQAFLEVVNHEYAQARYVRRLRRELGKADVAEPRSRLLALDTDGEAPPRFHVPGWERPLRASPGAEVVSLDERRQGRALRALERGHRLVGAGDLRGALRAFEESGSLLESADALTYQGWMQSLLGDLGRAEELCLLAIHVDPDFGNPYNDIGTFRLQQKDIPAAIKWFERAKRAKRYEPRHFPFINLGKLYLSLGMTEKALREFEGALTLSPANQEVRLAVEHLRRQVEGRES